MKRLLLFFTCMLALFGAGKAETYTLELTAAALGFDSSSYANNNGDHTVSVTGDNGTEMEVTIASNQVYLQSGKTDMQWQKTNGYLQNSTDLGTIKSITIASSGGTYNVYQGTSAGPSTSVSAANGVYNFAEGNGFFKIQVTSSAAGYVSKITVVFEKESSTNPGQPGEGDGDGDGEDDDDPVVTPTPGGDDTILYTDELIATNFTGISYTVSKDWTSASSKATYKAQATSNSGFQMRTSKPGCGIYVVTPSSDLIVKNITLEFSTAGGGVSVYASNSQISSASGTAIKTGVSGTTTLDINAPYFLIVPTNDTYTTVSKVTVNWVSANSTEEPEPGDERTEVTLSFPSDVQSIDLNGSIDASQLLTVNPEAAKGKVVYSSSDAESKYISLSTDGKITATNTPSYEPITITASIPENDEDYKPAKATLSIKVVDPNANDGSKDKPFTVSEYINLKPYDSDVYVVGYIVGSMPGGNINGATFTTAGASNTNMIIADSADETSSSKCMSIQLPSGSIRNALNLQDNHKNLGRKVMIYGTGKAYCGAPGINPTKSYEFLDELPPVVVEAPVFNPAPEEGEVELNTTVKITCATEGATIYYSYGEEGEKNEYSAPVAISPEKNTLKAWATLDGETSEAVEATYSFLTVATPVITPSSTKVNAGTEVSITCATEGATIYYTLLSDDEDVEEEVYTPGETKIVVNGFTMITAYAVKDNWVTSATAEVEYDVIGTNDPLETSFTFDFSKETNNVTSLTSNEGLVYSNTTSTDINNSLGSITFTSDEGVVLEMSTNSYSSAPRWWDEGNGANVRMYGNENGGNKMTVTAPTGFLLTRIEFTQLSGSTNFSFNEGAGKLDGKVWTNNEAEVASVDFNATGATRFEKLNVSYERTTHIPEYYEDNNDKTRVFKVKHGTIVVEEKGEEMRLVRRAGENLEYWTISEDGLTATYNVPETADYRTYNIYSTFNGVNSKAIEFNYEDFVTGVAGVEAENGEAVYFNLQGQKVANPEKGIYVKVLNGKAVKVVK